MCFLSGVPSIGKIYKVCGNGNSCSVEKANIGHFNEDEMLNICRDVVGDCNDKIRNIVSK